MGHAVREARRSTAAAESPPPTTVTAPHSAMAFATSREPASKGGVSKAPTGPFQSTVPASAITPANSRTVAGPTSRPSQPAGTLPSTTFVGTPAASVSAQTWSEGSRTRTSWTSASRRMSRAAWMAVSSTREPPTGTPCARRNV